MTSVMVIATIASSRVPCAPGAGRVASRRVGGLWPSLFGMLTLAACDRADGTTRGSQTACPSPSATTASTAAASALSAGHPQSISSGETPRYSWLLAFAGRTTNELLWDARFADLLRSLVRRSGDPGPDALTEELRRSLGGAPEDVVVADGRFVVATACRHHYCDERGYVWIDIVRGEVAAAILRFDDGPSSSNSSGQPIQDDDSPVVVRHATARIIGTDGYLSLRFYRMLMQWVDQHGATSIRLVMGGDHPKRQ